MNLKEIIDGHLLGDMNAEMQINPGKNTRLRQPTIHEEYAKFLVKQFSPFVKTKYYKAKKHYIRKNGTISKRFDFRSPTLPLFNEYRYRWYPDGTKIVPKDIEITPLVLLNWFLDDGHLKTQHRSYGKYNVVRMCTNGFSIPDQEFLIEKLIELGIKSKLESNGRGGKNGRKYLIAISMGSLDTFFNYMLDCPVDCFKYKWKRHKR